MINKDTAYQDDLLATTWLGEVVDVEDPQKVGRIKVKVYGKFDELKTEDIPWAYPGNNHIGSSPSGGGFFSVPKKGSIVSVKFDMGNIYHPEYFFEQKIADDVKTEVEPDYPTNDHTKTTHILLYDTADPKNLIKVYYTTSKGLMLDFLETQINIKQNKDVEIHTADGENIIEMQNNSGQINITTKNDNVTINSNTMDTIVKCKNAKITATDSIHLDCSKPASIKLGASVTDAVVLGDKFKAYFDGHTHIGNLGAPTSPPIVPMLPTTLSKTVKTQ